MADLERELNALGAGLAVPEPPDVRAAVRARITTPATETRRRLTGPRRWAVAAVAAVLATAVAATPQARAAVADLLRFAGVDVHWGSPDPDAPARAPLPGQRAVASLEAARQVVDFEVGAPAALGEPDRVLVADSGRVVSLLYGSRADRIRLDVFEGRLDPTFVKTIGEPVEYVDVGAMAVWLAGPHEVRYVDRDGVVRSESARLAANTLIWERGTVSYRLEGQLTRDRATAIAESVR